MSPLRVARKGIDAAVAPAVLVVLFGLASVLISWETKDKNGAWEE